MLVPLKKAASSMSFRHDRYRFLFFVVLFGFTVLLVRDYCLPPMTGADPALSSRVVQEDTTKRNKILDYDHNLPLIWIGGVPRSGTTLARAMLDAHPDVRCGEETRVIPRLLFMHNKMLASPIERSRLIEAKVSEDVLNDALGAYILSIIVEHGEPAPRYCNKDPFTLKSIDRIVKIFPQSKFILMVRDGRAVTHSIITRKVTITGFDTKTYRGALRDWNKAIMMMWNKCKEVGQEICLPVYYEQLVLHPEKEMRRLMKFLDVPWDSIVLHHEQTIGKAGGISLSKRERSTDQVDKPINMAALSKWVDAIPDDVKKDMDKIAPALRILGYDPTANPPKYGDPDSMVQNNTDTLKGELGDKPNSPGGNRLDGLGTS